MESKSVKLVGAPCGHRGTYTFYKALRYSCAGKERIIAISDFFFVRLWQDSELVSIGELLLLWTDRTSEQTLVSLRLYFLPENTPDGRSHHGEDEVLAINERVVVRAEDLLSWLCDGAGWRWGRRAVWRGACVSPAPAPEEADGRLAASRLDFADVEREKSALGDTTSPGVVVFSYPRYCRYRALLSRLDGLHAKWLRDSLVAALGGYAAPTQNTRILYCKDTFEYPELEGHEYVCNHLAPRLKGRPRGRRRRRARSASPHASPSDASDEGDDDTSVQSTPSKRRDTEDRDRDRPKVGRPALRVSGTVEDRAFLHQLRHFHKASAAAGIDIKGHTLAYKNVSARALYLSVARAGGYAAVCAARAWRRVLASAADGRAPVASHANHTRKHYERVLLAFEKYERRNGSKWFNWPKTQNDGDEAPSIPMEKERKRQIPGSDAIPIDTIDISDSPIRELPSDVKNMDEEYRENGMPRLRTPSPEHDRISTKIKEGPDAETGEEPSRSEPKVINATIDVEKDEEQKELPDVTNESTFIDNKLNEKKVEEIDDVIIENKEASVLNQEFLDSLPEPEKVPEMKNQRDSDLTDGVGSVESVTKVSIKPAEKLMANANDRSNSPTNYSALLNQQTIAEVLNQPSLLSSLARFGDAVGNLSALGKLSALGNLSGLGNISDQLASYAALAAAGLTNGQLPNGTMITVQPPADKASSGGGGSSSTSSSPPPSLPRGGGGASTGRATSSLRSVRVKPARQERQRSHGSINNTATYPPLRPDSASSTSPVTAASAPHTTPPSVTHTPTLTNFGINNFALTQPVPQTDATKRTEDITPPSSAVRIPSQNDTGSDDEIIEVPYRPKTPEIIDLDLYESPESPQAVVKRKKLDILKEGGLEVTAVLNEWPTSVVPPNIDLGIPIPHHNSILGLNPAIQQQIMNQAQFFQMYNIIPRDFSNGLNPPKVTQGKGIYSSGTGPEKTVYGNPKDPFMPPPHVLQGLPPRSSVKTSAPKQNPSPMPGADILDLTTKQKPAVEIMTVPNVSKPSRASSKASSSHVSISTNTSPQKSYSLVDGRAMVGSNLEITLVGPKTNANKAQRPPQKRSSTGKFMSNKPQQSPLPQTRERDIPSSPNNSYHRQSKTQATSNANLVIPSYQVSDNSHMESVSPSPMRPNDPSLSVLTNSLLQTGGGILQTASQKSPGVTPNFVPLIDPSLYMSALYNSLTGQMSGLTGQMSGLTDQHRVALLKEFMSGRFLGGYPGLLNPTGGATTTPTTKH